MNRASSSRSRTVSVDGQSAAMVVRNKRKKNSKRPVITKLTKGVGKLTVKEVGELGLAAYQMGKFAVSKLNTEYKYHGGIISTTPGTSHVFSLLNGIATGDTADSRDGASIRVKQLQILLSMVGNSASSVNYLRFVVIRVAQPKGSPPTAADIFESPTNPFNTTFNWLKRSEFQVLVDQRVAITYGTESAVVRDFLLDLDQHVAYTSSGSTVADISTGAFYAITVGQNTSNLGSFSFGYRMLFIDN